MTRMPPQKGIPLTFPNAKDAADSQLHIFGHCLWPLVLGLRRKLSIDEKNVVKPNLIFFDYYNILSLKFYFLKNKAMKRLLVPFLVLMFVSSCSKVPMTGRQQLTWIPSNELLQMSIQNYKETLSQAELSTDQQSSQMVQDVGKDIKGAVERYMSSINMSQALKGYEWQFSLIKSEEQNAWALPGGKVAFYEGILPICKDRNGVAVVMGHEVAHAIAEHGNERLTHGLLQQGLGTALNIALTNEPEKTQQLGMAAYGIGTTVFGILPFSRLHESEADHLGLILMAMAGYDPKEAPELWKRMAEAGGGSQPPEFLSTHPSHESRIKNLQEWMPEALKYYKKG